MESGRFQYHPLMRLTLAGMLLFLSGLWLSNFGVYFSRLGWSKDSVVSYYRGSEASFQAPRTFGSMIEVSHGHFAMMAMVLLVLTHLAIFIPAPRGLKIFFILGTFLSALLNELSGWLVRFVHPGFAWMKLPAFLIAQAFQLTLLIILALFLIHAARQPEPVEVGGRKSKRDRHPRHPHGKVAE